MATLSGRGAEPRLRGATARDRRPRGCIPVLPVSLWCAIGSRGGGGDGGRSRTGIQRLRRVRGPPGPRRSPNGRGLEGRRTALEAGMNELRPDTLAVRGGLARSNFDETSEGLFLTSGCLLYTSDAADDLL